MKFRALLFVLLAFLGHAAHAQTGCVTQTQAQLLQSLADNVYPGQITPQILRNIVCFSANPLIVSLASPPPIGGTAANAGTFTTLTATGNTTLSGTLTVASTISGTGVTNLFAIPPPIGSTTPNTGKFTTLNASGASTLASLSASGAVTGTGFTNLFASPPSIGNVAPAPGAFTTLSATSAISPSSTNGIVGTTTNDDPCTGCFGEYHLSNIVLGSAVSLSTGTPANITSLSLTSGDWQVCGNVVFNPAGSTTVTQVAAAISATSATLPTAPGAGAYSVTNATLTTGVQQAIQAGCVRFQPTTTQTVYLVAQSAFGTSTMTGYGALDARRMR